MFNGNHLWRPADVTDGLSNLLVGHPPQTSKGGVHRQHRLMQEIVWEDMKTRRAIHKVCSYILRSLIMLVKVIYISK